MADLGTKNPFDALRTQKKAAKPGEAPKEAAPKKPAAAAGAQEPAAAPQEPKARPAPTGQKRGGTQMKGRRGPGGPGGADADKRGKRTFDRQSGTGVPKGAQAKGGHGKHNWGKEDDGQDAGEADESTEQGDAGAGAAADGAAPAVGEDGKEVKAAEPAKPAEPEDKSLSFDEYQAQLAKKAVENDKLKAREVAVDDKKWGVTGVFKKADNEENLKIGGKDAKAKEKARKNRKGISLDEFVKETGGATSPSNAGASSPPPAASPSSGGDGGFQDRGGYQGQGQGDRPFRGGRGGRGRGGRGGEFRGRGDGRGRGRGRGRGGRAPNVDDAQEFPKMGN